MGIVEWFPDDNTARRVHGDDLPVTEALRRLLRPDDAWDAELARDDCGVACHAARVGGDRRRPAHQWDPVGRGHPRDEHVAVVEPAGVGERAEHADRPARSARRRAEPTHQNGGR